MKKFPILPMLNNSKQIITDSQQNIVETRNEMSTDICFLIRGIRWKPNFVGPLGFWSVDVCFIYRL